MIVTSLRGKGEAVTGAMRKMAVSFPLSSQSGESVNYSLLCLLLLHSFLSSPFPTLFFHNNMELLY